jgi:hypothetical protein
MKKKKGSKSKKVTKPYKIIPFIPYFTWASYRALSLKKIGVLVPKHKDYHRRYQANVNKEIYAKEKEIYLKKHLNKLLVKKYDIFKRKNEEVKKDFKKVITDSLKKQGYTKEVIRQILIQKNILKSISEFQKTSENKKKQLKIIRTTKNTVYDYKDKKRYIKDNYNRKLGVERYWLLIHSLSKSLGMSIKETRGLYKLGGKEFFTVLEERIEYPEITYASPEELKAYWANAKAISKEVGLSVEEVRAILKLNPNHFNKLK